jgi:hypothetical protein
VTTGAALVYAMVTSAQTELGSKAGDVALGHAPTGEVKKR